MFGIDIENDFVQKMIGTILTLILLPPLGIAILSGAAVFSLSTLFFGFDPVALVAFIAIVVSTILLAYFIYQMGWQSMVLGGTFALILIALYFIVFGGLGGALALMTGQLGALIVLLVVVILVGLSLLIGWYNWIGYFKGGG